MPNKATTITQKVIIAATPEEVYEAFVNPKKHAAFTDAEATGSGKIGGKFTAWDGYIYGVNRELVKGKKIVQDWKTTEWPEDMAPSKFELTFRAVKGGTEIKMVHSNVPAEQAASLKSGWTEYYWEPLKEYFSGK